MKLKSNSRQEQLEKLRRRYAGRGGEGKSRILDESCEQYGYHRKHAIRLLNGTAIARKSPPGPQRHYEAITEVVEKIWAAGEQPCGKRLVQMLSLWLPHYQRRYGKLRPIQRKLAEQVSPSDLGPLVVIKVIGQVATRGMTPAPPASPAAATGSISSRPKGADVGCGWIACWASTESSETARRAGKLLLRE